MISFENLTKNYGKTTALADINFSMSSNKSYALLGPNGSGKTTLIKCILGMVLPSSGKLLVNGKAINTDYHYRGNIGYMPQSGQYPSNMTVEQVFDMMKDLRKQSHAQLDEELMEAWDISSIKKKKTSALSGGTRQKLSACLAFLFNPDILILDEPTAGLDPLSSEILKEKIIRETEKHKLIIITSHILSDLDEIITDLVYLQDGQLMLNKPMNELKNETGENSLSKIISKFMKERVLA